MIRLQPVAHPEVLLGLTAMSIIRGLQGFQIFLLAFGLRRLHVGLYVYGLALGAAGIGSIVGLALVGRLRERLNEQHLLLLSLWLIAVCRPARRYGARWSLRSGWPSWSGWPGRWAQPSFAAMTQRYIPQLAQGRAFARFATRQQLVSASAR